MTVITPVGLIDAEVESDASTTPLVFTCPAGVEDDDLLIMIAGDLTGSAATGPPAGWTQVAAQALGTNPLSGVYTRIASVSAADSGGHQDVPGSTTYAPAIVTGRTVGALFAFRNVDTTTPLADIQTASSSTGTTTIPFATVTPTEDGSYCLALSIARPVAAGGQTTYTAPVDWAKDVDECTTSGSYGNLALGVFSQQQDVAAPISGLKCGVGASSKYMTYLLAINPVTVMADPNSINISVGGSTPTAVYVGGSSVTAVYVGDVKVFPAPPQTPPPVTDPTLAYMTAEDLTIGDYHTNGYDTQAAGTTTSDGSVLFDYFNMGTNGINDVSTADPVSGTKSFHFSSNGHAVSSYNAWIAAVDHATPEYLAAQYTLIARGATAIVMQLRSTSNGSMAAIQLTSAGSWNLLETGGAVIATGSTTIPLNAPFRLELGVITLGSGTSGHCEARLFLDPFGTTPDEVLDGSGANVGTTAAGRDIFGIYSQLIGWEMYVDNMRKSNQGYPAIPSA